MVWVILSNHTTIKLHFWNNPKYCDRQAWASSVDPDQMPQDVAYDLGLHCLSLIQQSLDTATDSKMELFKLCVEVLRPSQPNGVMSSAVSLPDHTFTGQA